MGTQYPALTEAHVKFIQSQHLFFVGSAALDGRVNISPKGMDSLRVLSPDRIIWRNLTGSGNETAGHLAEVNRITMMWCGFEKVPMILRAYGTAQTLHPKDAEFAGHNDAFPPSHGARQIYDVRIEMVQKSCGYAVPFMEYAGDRDVLKNWAEDKGPEGIQTYWEERNQRTIDDKPTGIVS